jgi:gliding motility-associated-like protein
LHGTDILFYLSLLNFIILHLRNYFIIFLWFLSLQIASSQTPFTCKGQYYLSLTKGGTNSSGLYEVKISDNGQRVLLDTISSGIGLVLNAMGYRITDNFIYGMDPNSSRLRKIGSDGVAVDLGLPKDIPLDPLYYAGDVTPDGRFLLLIGLGGITAQIVKIDLEHPEYQCTFVPMQDRTVGIVDIAFDPFTGILYGHDLRNKRLVIVNPETGAVNTDFSVQSQVDQLGALFFDSFGNLYGYGSFGTLTQDKFVSVNKKTGEISLLAQGPISSGQDGCACPYTLELQKTVYPEIAYPCTEVIYSFIISNGSGILRTGIQLSDTMPEGLIAKSIVSNPFGGNVILKNNIISISGMNVKVGIDTVKVLVEVGPDALGLYRNQAILSGLPEALGSFTNSDNPATFIEKDSTDLLVKPLDLSFITEDYSTCPGDSVLADVSLHGLKYLWSDGDTSSKKWLSSPGNYRLSVKSLCDEKQIDITVKNDLITLNILEDTIFLDLGEKITLLSEYTNSSENVTFLWQAEGNDEVLCITCSDTEVLPLNDGYYKLSMTSEDKCVIADIVYVRVKKDRSVYHPNIISANGDNINDVFFLSGNALSSQGQFLRIFDRWGNKVFESNAFVLNESSSGWDGTFRGKSVVPGVYTWVASLKYIDGFEQWLRGDITVIK